MEEDAEILEPFEIHFSDLMLLASSSSISSSTEERKRLDNISRNVMEALGPLGPGLLAITGVPKASELRRTLLPLGRKLSLLGNEDRRRILKKHSLGTDVSLKNLDRNVSSFAMQLKYVQDLGSESDHICENKQNLNEGNFDSNEPIEFRHNEFKNLGVTFKELGFCMMDLGLCLARVCDKAVGGQELEKSILDSCTAKGRLIHYHSNLDNIILKEAGNRKGSSGAEVRSCRTSLSNLWQQWHYDYGIFTVLTVPMFISSGHNPSKEAKYGLCMQYEQGHPPPIGHTYLQIFNPNKNKVFMVRSHPENFIIQVGESADILSKGKLRSTLHSVCRPEKLENLSRETFVVFLQPAWNKIFFVSEYSCENSNLNGQYSETSNEGADLANEEVNKLSQEIHKIVPPLSSRLKDGMTFAEFSRETTKQYYGGSGLQSKR